MARSSEHAGSGAVAAPALVAATLRRLFFAFEARQRCHPDRCDFEPCRNFTRVVILKSTVADNRLEFRPPDGIHDYVVGEVVTDGVGGAGKVLYAGSSRSLLEEQLRIKDARMAILHPLLGGRGGSECHF